MQVLSPLCPAAGTAFRAICFESTVFSTNTEETAAALQKHIVWWRPCWCPGALDTAARSHPEAYSLRSGAAPVITGKGLESSLVSWDIHSCILLRVSFTSDGNWCPEAGGLIPEFGFERRNQCGCGHDKAKVPRDHAEMFGCGANWVAYSKRTRKSGSAWCLQMQKLPAAVQTWPGLWWSPATCQAARVWRKVSAGGIAWPIGGGCVFFGPPSRAKHLPFEDWVVLAHVGSAVPSVAPCFPLGRSNLVLLLETRPV